MPQNYHKRHPRRDELIEIGKRATFYGIPVTEMESDDLYMMIGYLSEEKEQERTFQNRKNSLLGDLRAAAGRAGRRRR